MRNKLTLAEAGARAERMGWPKAVISAAVYDGAIKGIQSGAVMQADQDSFEAFLMTRGPFTGSYFKAVASASVYGVEALQPHQRAILAAATTVGTEQTGADGGFAVPIAIRDALKTAGGSFRSIRDRCDHVVIGSNVLYAARDDAAPWQSVGPQAAWYGELETINQSKLHVAADDVKLAKLAAYVPVTDELLEDANSLAAIIPRLGGNAIDYKLEEAILLGNGVGMPLGVKFAPSTITIAAEGAQTPDTLNQANVAKLISRLHAASVPGAVAVMHPDAYAAALAVNAPIIGPADDNAHCGRLLGLLPIIPHEGCETVGDIGDVIVGDFSQYMLVTRTPDWVGSASLDVWFDQSLAAFKFTFRAVGQPWAGTAVASRAGSNTRSAFTQLAAR